MRHAPPVRNPKIVRQHAKATYSDIKFSPDMSYSAWVDMYYRYQKAVYLASIDYIRHVSIIAQLSSVGRATDDDLHMLNQVASRFDYLRSIEM